MDLRVRLVSSALAAKNVKYDEPKIRRLMNIYPMQRVFEEALEIHSRRGWRVRISSFFRRIRSFIN